MGAKIFAAVTLIIILGFVIINDLALKNDIDELSRLVEESQTYYEAEAAQDFYEEKKEFIGYLKGKGHTVAAFASSADKIDA